LIKKLNLLDSDNINILSDALSLVCQFCRISPNYYKPIHELNIYNSIKKCITHADPSIRSKTNNLIGHMCRHSDFFYEHILRNNLLEDCIKCCKDQDSATRKFASFALGNAAFHNDKLYEVLKPSISLIIALLDDKDEKTRANASGALGNFARNSGALIGELMNNDTIKALFAVATSPPSAPSSKDSSLVSSG
jgi:fused-like protein